MPNYEFHCSSCGEIFDRIVTYGDRDQKTECPACQKVQGKRQVSAARVSYKGAKSDLARAGSGWNDVLKKVKGGSAQKNTIRTR
jgi:putative FmdB family regulatory protein